MKIFKKILVLIMITIITFTLLSTTKIIIFASPNITNRKVTNIAVLFHRFSDPYVLLLKQSFEDIQKKNEDKVRFIFFDANDNVAVQNEQINSAIQDSFDFLIINFVDVKEDTVIDVINKAKSKDIPLVLVQIPPQIISKVNKYYNKAAFVGVDERQSGIAEGNILVDLWNTNKNVIDKNNDDIMQYIMLKGPSENKSAIERTKGAISAINDAGIKTQELATINASWSKELAKSSIENLLLRYANKIEAIISNNDAMAVGAIEALQKYGYNTGDKSKYIAVVGFNGLPQAKDLIDKGFMTGTVVHDPKLGAEQLYTIGLNLVTNVNPLTNTNSKLENGEIIMTIPQEVYTKKTNSP